MNFCDIINEENKSAAGTADEKKIEATADVSDETEEKTAEENVPSSPAGTEPVSSAADETADIDDPDDAADSGAALDDGARLSAVCDPMFATFAKGKDQPLDELISDFIKMRSLGSGEIKPSPMTLATPVGAAASPDYALSERQRKIAQSAGMSYREYYNFLKSMK